MTLRAARLTAVVLALAGAGVSGAAVSGIASTGAAGANAGPSPGGRVTLAQQTPWVSPGQSFQLRLAISSAVPRANLAVSVTVFNRLTSRSAFSQTLQGRDVGVLRELPPVPVSTLPPGPAGDVIVTIPIVSSPIATAPQAPAAPAERNLDLSSCPNGCEGVYPVQVELEDQAVNRPLDRFTTHLVFAKAPTTGSKLGFTWIQPAHAPPALAPDGHRSLPPEQSRQLSELAGSLARHETVPVTLAPTPETMQALAESPRPADHQTLATFNAVAADPLQQVLTGPYVPVSLSGLSDVGLADQATAQVARGSQVLGTTLHAPSNPHTLVTVGPIDQADVGPLRSEGVDHLVVPDTSLAASAGKLTLTQPFQLAGSEPGQPLVTAADSGLSSHFTSGGDQVLAAHQLLADLAEIYFEQPGSSQPRAVVVEAPLDWPSSSAFLSAALDGLTQSPIVQPLTLASLDASIPAVGPSGAPVVRQLVTQTSDARVPVAALRSAQRRLASFSTVVSNDPRLLGEMGDMLLVGQSSDLRPPDQARYMSGVQDQIGAQLGKLTLAQDRTITLTSRTGRIPITVISQAGFTVHAVLTVASDKLTFPNGSTQVLALDRRDNPEYFDVSARASGDFPLSVSLVSPNGDLVLLNSRFTVRSTATSAVAIALSVGAGAFLLGWWARYLIMRRRERSRRLVRPGH
ncbi:MAG TPA: DUF6049 family protein [Acidimicrobiales bacterium]|nr:DUF6049 family protein [Acidimicrobiales bacterium]